MCQVEFQDIVSGCRGVHVEEIYVYKKQCKICTARVSPSVLIHISIGRSQQPAWPVWGPSGSLADVEKGNPRWRAPYVGWLDILSNT